MDFLIVPMINSFSVLMTVQRSIYYYNKNMLFMTKKYL